MEKSASLLQSDPRSRRKAPGPQSFRPMGSLHALATRPLDLFYDSWKQYGDVVRYRIGPRSSFLIVHPEDVKWLLLTNGENYSKETRGYKKLSVVFGKGLLTSNGKLWKQQRRIIQPAFRREEIIGYTKSMSDVIAEILDGWKPAVRSGEPFDVSTDAALLAIRVVGATLLGTDLGRDAKITVDAVNWLMPKVAKQMTRVFNLPLFLPTQKNKKFRESLQAIDNVVQLVIQRHRNVGKCPMDLVSTAITGSVARTGEAMCPVQLRDEVATMLIAGYETTANAITWSLYFIATRPEVGAQIAEEVDRVLKGRMPREADISELKYTLMVLRESMRLLPPSFVQSRYALTDDEIRGYFIPAKSVVITSPFVTHRHPEFWANPDDFLPSRFSVEKKIHPFAYFPFGAGPRKCIGHQFAEQEVLLALAMIAQRYRVSLAQGFSPKLEAFITLRPLNGMMITVKEREAV